MRKLILVMLIVALFSSIVIHSCAENSPVVMQEKLLKSRESYTKIVEIDNTPYIIYAQNSPDWELIRAGKENKSIVRDSLCSVFALSNIIVNSVNINDLNKILELTKNEISFDTKSLNPNKGYKGEYKFKITLDEDYLRYFPMCIGNYLSGNTKKGNAISIQTTSYYMRFLNLYDLKVQTTKKLNECIELVKTGAMACVCSGGKRSPIAPKNGHYLVMAHVDDEYVYFIDSIFRNKYENDKNHIIDVITPGLFRVKHDNVKKLCIAGQKFVVWSNNKNERITSARYREIVRKSNSSISNISKGCME